jgi:hypothetical protein
MSPVTFCARFPGPKPTSLAEGKSSTFCMKTDCTTPAGVTL